MRTIILALLTMACAFWAPVSHSDLYSDDYDQYFNDYTDVFLPAGTDPLLLKSQCYQESRLNPFAQSPVGASGLCQFMPGTWEQASNELGVTPEDVWLPGPSIRAAAWYMGKLHRTWSSPRPAMDRYMIAAASYNAGAGHLIQAQRLCGGENRYKKIVACLPRVTGRHADETIGYVKAIVRRWYPALLFGS